MVNSSGAGAESDMAGALPVIAGAISGAVAAEGKEIVDTLGRGVKRGFEWVRDETSSLFTRHPRASFSRPSVPFNFGYSKALPPYIAYRRRFRRFRRFRRRRYPTRRYTYRRFYKRW